MYGSIIHPAIVFELERTRGIIVGWMAKNIFFVPRPPPKGGIFRGYG